MDRFQGRRRYPEVAESGPRLTRGLRRWTRVQKPQRAHHDDISRSDPSRDCRPRGGLRCRIAAGNGGERPGAPSPLQRSGADRDRQSFDRCSHRSAAAGRPEPTTGGLADPGQHPARGGRAGRHGECGHRHPVADLAVGQRARRDPTLQRRLDGAGALGGCGGDADRGDAAGQPVATVCQSRRRRRIGRPAAGAATGGDAIAGATNQPRSKSHWQRRPERL